MTLRPQPGQASSKPQPRDVANPTIVVGLDGSQTSWNAFWWACGEAARSAGRLVAAFVTSVDKMGAAQAVSVLAGTPLDYRAFESATTQQAAALEADARKQASEQYIPIEFVHTYGDPATELASLAQQAQADLIVVGKSTSIIHHLAGSVSKRLTGHRTTPVIVVVP
jgi:nucleotide-binding universal stress UspA family protein